jgi:hypothetical protein
LNYRLSQLYAWLLDLLTALFGLVCLNILVLLIYLVVHYVSFHLWIGYSDTYVGRYFSQKHPHTANMVRHFFNINGLHLIVQLLGTNVIASLVAAAIGKLTSLSGFFYYPFSRPLRIGITGLMLAVYSSIRIMNEFHLHWLMAFWFTLPASLAVVDPCFHLANRIVPEPLPHLVSEFKFQSNRLYRILSKRIVKDE